MVLEKMKSGVTEAAASIDSKLKDSLSFLSDIKDAGWEAGRIKKLVFKGG